jgi:hypothetical protein
VTSGVSDLAEPLPAEPNLAEIVLFIDGCAARADAALLLAAPVVHAQTAPGQQAAAAPASDAPMTNAPVAAMGEAPKAISAQGVTTAPAATGPTTVVEGAPAPTASVAHDAQGKEIVVVAERIPGQVEAAQPRWP